MAVFYSPVFQETQFKSDATLAVGYNIYTYAEGSSTPLTTYTTSLGNVAQANPIVLNARGEPNNPIWLTGGLGYKFVYTTDADVVIRTIDNVRGVGDSTSTSDQYVTFGGTATYISATSFSLIGDQTSTFEAGRAVKLLTSGGTVYAKISTSAFTTLTTITIQQASGSLDAGLTGTNPSYGLISNNNNALPTSIDSRVQNQSATSGTAGGTATAITFTATPAYSTPSAGVLQAYNVTMPNAATGVAATFNGLPIKTNDGSDPTWSANFKAILELNAAATQWILKNPLPVSVVIQPLRQTVISGAVGGDAATVTISNATPGVVTHTAHGKEANTPLVFTTTGGLPTGLSLLTQYYISATGLTANTYQVSATAGGASINTSSAGSGTHTATYGVLNNASGTPLLGGALGATSVVTSNINATTPLRVSYAGGFNASGQVDLIGNSTSNLTFSSLSTNGTMYGYLTYSAGANTTSTGTLAPVVQQQGIPSTVSGQYTYNIKEAKMYLGNGSVATAVNTVHVATFTVAASVVSAITWNLFQQNNAFIYKLNGSVTGISATNATTGSISFGTIFTSIPKVFTHNQNGGTGGSACHMIVTSVTTTGFNYIINNFGNTGNTTAYVWGAET
jgi:hypothetical protein